jgi:N6-adenosine-specific RNA methylase IME4
MRGTIIIDPPWPYETSVKHKAQSGWQYDSVTLQSLATLPINQLGSYVFLWTTVGFVEEGYRLIRHWGFEPVTMIAWIKATTRGVRPIPFSADVIEKHKPQTLKGLPTLALTPNYGIGYWFRGAFEPIIVGKLPKARAIKTQWIGLMTPNLKHSQKPDSLYQLIESDYPKPHIELFARRQRDGWTCLGNEISGNDIDYDVKRYLRRR